MGAQHPAPVHLRPTRPVDVPTLFQFDSDPESNRLAATKPRDFTTFSARWAEVLVDPAIVPRVIVSSGAVVGCINMIRQDGMDSIGYLIAREHWGKGYATRAIALMIEEVTTRPLYARVAVHNVASVRALERNGFVVTARSHLAETERFVAGERLMLTLA